MRTATPRSVNALRFPREMGTAIDSILVHSPAHSWFQRRSSRGLVVLAYHGVRDTENFSQHVQYLDSAMHPVSLDQTLESIAYSRTLPSKSVLITFDDGDRSVYECALPILRQYAVPAVAFVIAGLLDTEQPLWWDEVKELVRRGARLPHINSKESESCIRTMKRLPDDQRLHMIAELRRLAPPGPIAGRHLRRSELLALEEAGIRIGNHTLTHPVLMHCSDQKVVEEVVSAHEILREATGRAPRAFAFPNGNYDSRAAKVLSDLAYEAAFLFDHQVSEFPPLNRFRISRVRVDSTTPLDRFRLIISGLHPALHRAVGRS